MSGHISFSIQDNCYNIWETYGGICVWCGCCTKDRIKRTKSRLKLFERMLDESLNFNQWDDDPELRAIQGKNVASDIKWARRRVAYYRKRLAELQRTTNQL